MAKKKNAPEMKAPLRGLQDDPTNCNSYIVHDPDHELAMKVTDGSVDGVWLDGVDISGGGGESPFTTATVTITTPAQTTMLSGPVVDENNGYIITTIDPEQAGLSAVNFTIVLYNGAAVIYDFYGSATPTVTGSAQTITLNYMTQVKVTGDCAIVYA